jgi:hypothetical protein
VDIIRIAPFKNDFFQPTEIIPSGKDDDSRLVAGAEPWALLRNGAMDKSI